MSVGKSGIASNALNCVVIDISFIIFFGKKIQISSRIIEFEIWIVSDLF
jgi:hypothetical protein